jgi:hypothetical protein
MAHGDAREGKWKENWRMEQVASALHTTMEYGVSSITTADAHTSAASSLLNWRPPADLNGLVRFARKTKSGFCAYAITFQTQSTELKDKSSYEQNHRPISGHKYQSTSKQRQPRSAKNDWTTGWAQSLSLITNIYYKKITWNTNFFFKCNSTQEASNLSDLSNGKKNMFVFHVVFLY